MPPVPYSVEHLEQNPVADLPNDGAVNVAIDFEIRPKIRGVDGEFFLDGAGDLARHTAVVEDAAKDAKARARLAELRSSMGISSTGLVEADATEEPQTSDEEE